LDINSHTLALWTWMLAAHRPLAMDAAQPDKLPLGLRNPADILFQKDGVRRAIIIAYWTAIILAIPLWWHTTSIERLPLPEARVSQQVDKPVTIPVTICLQGANLALSSRLQNALDGQKRAASRWEGLDTHVTSAQCGMCIPVFVSLGLIQPSEQKQMATHTLYQPVNRRQYTGDT
jgi:phosphatidylinositol glycan class S